MNLSSAALLFVVFATAAAPAFSQSAAAFHPAAGAEWRISEQRTRENGVGTIVGRIRVIGADKDGFEMDWTTISVTAGGQVLTGVKPEMLIGVPIPYRASKDGSPLRIVGVEQMLASMDETFAAMGSGAATNKATWGQVKSMFMRTDPASLAQSLLVEPALFGGCHNFDLPLSESVTQQTKTPGLGGSPPMLANVTMTLVPGALGQPVEIRVMQTLDAASALASAKALSESARAQQGLPPETGPAPTLSRTVETTCRVDAVSGEALSVRSDMKMQVGAKHTRDLRELKIERTR